MPLFSARFKQHIKSSPWMYPVRWIWTIFWLPKLLDRLNVATATGTDPSLQPAFSFTREAPPLLERAEKRHTRAVKTLTAAEKSNNFYSYFSEIGDEGYERNLRAQYEAYLPFFKGGQTNTVLDIGSGAGEFIAFLGEHGCKARGLEKEASEVERSSARGLDVVQGEALDYLKKTTEHFAAISMIEVIEHLPPEQISPLLALAFEKIEAQGILLIETINMRHPLAADGFYTDPTHIRPVTEDYLTFLMQWHGFQNVKIVYTNPVWLPGVSPNDAPRIYCTYAAIGSRA